MPIDPDDPPIWLRKLHVTAAQISPIDYPAALAAGILTACRLSDEILALSKAFYGALPSRTQSTDEIPLRSASEPKDATQQCPSSRLCQVAESVKIICKHSLQLNVDYLWL